MCVCQRVRTHILCHTQLFVWSRCMCELLWMLTCMNVYIVTYVTHDPLFCTTVPTVSLPRSRADGHSHGADRVSSVNPHKRTVSEAVPSRGQPSGVGLPHMPREAGTRELCQGVEHVLGFCRTFMLCMLNVFERIYCVVRDTWPPFSYNSPNSVTPSVEGWRSHCHIADRVSPVDPHKCTVSEAVLSRDHPSCIRPTHMPREAGTRELCQGGEHVLGF